MKKTLVGLLLAVSLGVAQADPAGFEDAALQFQTERARALITPDLFDYYRKLPATHYKRRAERNYLLNLIARLSGDAGQMQVLRSEDLWLDDPLWLRPEDARQAAAQLRRHAVYREELAVADRLFEAGAYRAALEHLKKAGQSLPLADEAVRREASQALKPRLWSLEELLDTNDLSPQWFQVMLGARQSQSEFLKGPDAAVRANVCQMGLRSGFGLHRQGYVALAEDHFRWLRDATATAPADPTVAWTNFIANSYLAYQEDLRNPQTREQLRQSFEAAGAKAEEQPLSLAMAASTAEALQFWQEALGTESADWLEKRPAKWSRARALQRAPRHLQLLRAGRLIDAGELKAAEKLLQAVEAGLASELDGDLAALEKDLGEKLESQERQWMQGRLLLERARLGRADADAMLGAVELAVTRRDRVDRINEFSPALRKLNEAEFLKLNEQARRMGWTYPLGVTLAQGQLGLYHLEKGRPDEAREHLQEAVRRFDRYLGEVRAAGPESERLRRPMREVYEKYAELQLKGGDGRKAFETIAKAEQAAAPATPVLRSQNAQMDAKLQAAIRKKDELRLLEAAQKPDATLIARTKGEFFTLVRELRGMGKNFEGILAFQPVEFAQLQRQLPKDTVLVQYYPTDKQLYLFVVSATDFKVHQVAAPREALFRQVAAYRQELLDTVSPKFEWGSAEARKLKGLADSLSTTLVDPLAGELATHPVLAVIPTQDLLYLPFGSLTVKGEPILQKNQLVTLLRASDMNRLDAQAPAGQKRLAAFGNPDGSLPGAQQEVEELSKLFPDTKLFVRDQATPDQLLKLQPPDYLHLATHAVLDSRDPNRSYLVMAGKSRLGVNEIFELPLQKTRLVALSACETQLGEQQPGASVSSLAEAFWVAGCPTLLASLWKVEDNSTRELMLRFYGKLKEGQPVGEALRVAQLELSSQAGTRHPFFWAPFVLIGDWR